MSRRTVHVAAAAVLTLSVLAGCGTPPAPTAGTTPETTGPTSAGTTPAGTSATSPSAPATRSATTTSTPSATGTATGTATTTASSRPSATGSSASGSCAALAGSMTRSERIGQLFMVGENSEQISSTQLNRIHDLHIGSVILLGNTTEGRSAVRELTDDVRSRAGTTHGVTVLLAADQEGGLVQRLKGTGFESIPSAQSQADYSDSSLRSHAQTWGEQLGQAGIDADLAPVADVVPSSMEQVNQPIGVLRRGYGPDPSTVAEKVTAFVEGMHAAHIATSVKHFPGLGRVRGNTDTDAHVTDDVTTRHDADLAGFAAGVRHDTDLVMVSSATYAKIDPDRPATFSSTVVRGMIRSDLGFGGVVISDDLIGQALTSVPMSQRAVRFIEAGGDLAIVGDPDQVSSAIDGVSAQAARDGDFDAEVTTAATRVLALKAKYGLADCS